MVAPAVTARTGVVDFGLLLVALETPSEGTIPVALRLEPVVAYL